MIRADTVFLNEPISINYKLIIRARVVSINHPITMTFLEEEFVALDIKTLSENHVLFDNTLTMRHRKYGFVDILDVLPTQRTESPGYKYSQLLMYVKFFVKI